MADTFSGKSENTPEAWMGEVQRSHLSGFARLRAIFWRRSLRLYEGWALRDRPWVRQLRRELRREFAQVDPDDASRLSRRSDIFGETPILTVVRLLDLARSFQPDLDTFLDLGSGRGTTCLAAANCGFVAIGIEKEADWVRRAAAISSRLGWSARFECGDFLKSEWPDKAAVFVVATAFPQDLRRSLAARVKALQPGSILIAGDWPGLTGFESLWEGSLPVDWGIIRFSIYRG